MAEVDDTGLERKIKKKLKKKKEHDMTDDDVVIQSPKKHKKKKRESDDDHPEIFRRENGDDCEPYDKTVEVHKKKKKKKKNKEVDNEDEIGMPPALKKKKNKEKEITEKNEAVRAKDTGDMKKKRKKKNKESREELTSNVEIDANGKPELRKKKRRSDGSDNDTQCKKTKSSKSLVEANTGHDQGSVYVKKKKKRKRLTAETLPKVEISPRKSKKDNKHSSDIDTVQDSKSATNGSVDTASDTVKNIIEPVVGQWGTSSLGSDARQQKFIRLMGGFKKGGDSAKSSGAKQSKGLFGSLKATPSTMNSISHGGNKAMDSSQEKMYLTNMEKDYERAMSMNLNRGIGLGFEKPPGEGKKFYIDTKASKSIKFDD